MSSRQPPFKIYSSKRRQRSISNPHSRPPLSSSPLKLLSTEDEDLTITEMSLRMKKRSRASMKRLLSGDALKASSVGTSPLDRPEDDRPAKRSKVQASGHRTPLAEVEHANSNVQNILPDEGTQDDMYMASIAEIKTPAVREGLTAPPPLLKAPANEGDASEKDEESDFLSPLPTSKFAKRVTAHRSSSSLKEKCQKQAAGSLASPFNSRPGSPGHHTQKENRDKRINRTRSVGHDLRKRAALRSFSRAESPSSNASSPGVQKSSETWSVPAHVKHTISQKTPRRPSDTGVLPSCDTSFFDSSPIACSTPPPKAKASISSHMNDFDATPRLPPFDFDFDFDTSANNSQDDMILDDPTPRAPLNTDSLLDAQLTSHRFASVQERMVSISSDTSGSGSKKSGSSALSTSTTLAPPSSPARGPALVSPNSSGGNELHNMFDTLGLDEDETWFQNNVRPSGTSSARPLSGRRILKSAGKKKRSSLSARDNRLDKATSSALKRSSKPSALPNRRVSIELPAPSASRARAKSPALSPQFAQAGSSAKGERLPSIRMRIIDSPIIQTSGSDDELLLVGSVGSVHARQK